MEKIELDNYHIVLDDTFQALSTFLLDKKEVSMIVLVDENTNEHCLPLLKKIINGFEVIQIKSGEAHKNLTTCEFIWQQLIQFNTDRKALFINLGGGVIGDMGGFAASCYKRGIDFINIPTTVLSQVDSSIGGKLGIDFKYGKNLIGLFQNPKAVFISSVFFNSLPKRQFINGWAEIFKHALIKDATLWQQYKSIDIFAANMNAIVYNSLQIKKTVVEADPYEKGLRKILNFGHTIGHAIEAYSLETEGDDCLLHGEAIAIGMICEAYLSTQKLALTQTELNEIIKLLLKHFPKKNITSYNREKLLDSILLDKKNEKNTILAALLNHIGDCKYDIPISKEDINQSIDFYCSL